MRKIIGVKPELGFRASFDAIISKSLFSIPRDSTSLSLIFTLEDKQIGSIQVVFDTGVGWQSFDGGRHIKHPFRHNFLAKSEVGCLIKRVVGDLDIHMYERGLPTYAEVWVGLIFHWKMEEIILEEKQLPGEKFGKIVHLMPDKFLGGHKNRDPFEELARLIKNIKTKASLVK